MENSQLHTSFLEGKSQTNKAHAQAVEDPPHKAPSSGRR